MQTILDRMKLRAMFESICGPDELLADKIRSIPQNVKTALASSLIFSVLVHGAFFWNKFVNEDSMYGIVSTQRHLFVLGRWAVRYFSALRGYYAVPWVVGAFAIAYVVISVCVVVYLLEIKSKPLVVLSSFLYVSFPTLAYWFGYAHIADKLPASILLAVLSVWFAHRYKFGFLPGALLLMLSLATYQASIGYAAGLSVIILVKHLLRDNGDGKRTAYEFARYLLLGFLGLAFYMVSVRVSLFITGGELSPYAGADTMGQIPISEIPGLVAQSFVDFVRFFTRSNRFFYVSRSQFLLYAIVALLVLYYLVSVVISKRIYRQPVKMLLLSVLLAVMPVALNLIGVLTPERRPGTLNIHQFVLAIMFAFMLLEIHKEQTGGKLKMKIRALSEWAVMGVTFLIALNFMIMSGQYYFRLHIFYERTFAFYNRVLMRIEEAEGFRGDLPLAFFGHYPPYVSFRPSSVQFPELINSQGVWGQFVGVNSNQPHKPRNFIDHFLGVNFALAPSYVRDRVANLPDFLSMPIWPHQGSVAVVDGVIVVKLSQPDIHARIVVEQIDGPLHRISSSHAFPEEMYFAYYIFRNRERIEVIWYTQGLAYIEMDFTETGRYSFIIFVMDGEGLFTTTVYGDEYTFEP